MTVFDQNCSWLDHLPTGWRPIFRHLVTQLAALDPNLRVVQAKQKFGALRVYLDRYNERAETLIAAAEKDTRCACEECGAPARLTVANDYYATLCDRHRGDAKPAASAPVFRLRIIPPHDD
jgi:hypothetical protein